MLHESSLYYEHELQVHEKFLQKRVLMNRKQLSPGTEHARYVSKWCEQRDGGWNEPYHDTEQLKEGKVSERWESGGALFTYSGSRSTFEKVQRTRTESHKKQNRIVCLLCFSGLFLVWVVTMATNVFINNAQPQPPQPTMVLVQPNQWSTGICDCFDDMQVCESGCVQPHLSATFHFGASDWWHLR